MTKPQRKIVDTDLLDLHPKTLPWPQRIAASTRGMASSQHYRATEAMVSVL